VTPSPTVVATELEDGQAVLLDMDTGSYVQLNRTAAVIWAGIESGRSLDAIAAKLVSTFEVDDEHAHRSMDAFVEQLVEAGLAQWDVTSHTSQAADDERVSESRDS
jgi:hypothetical protein